MDTINLVNNGKPYFFRLDIAKESGQIARFTDWIKTRVSDNGKKVPIQWYDQGTVMNVHGFYPFIEGGVGKWIKDDDTGELVPSTDVVYRTWQGTPADTSDNGIAYYTLEDQFFIKQGEFVGTFGLRDDNGNNLTSVNLVFSVLGNDLRLTQAKDYYIKDLENLKRKFENDGNQAVADFNEKIEAGTETDRQTLDALRASIQANRDGQASIAEQQASIIRQIKDNDIVTVAKQQADINEISQAINNRLSQLHNGPVAIENAEMLKSKYPQGSDGTFLTLDTNHIWIWLNNQWKDAGEYQAAGLSQQAQQAIENTRSIVLGNELISNGSFATGKTDPAIPWTGDTHLAVKKWSNRNWLQISSDGNSPFKGVQWNLNNSDKTYFDNPLQLDFDIRSLEDKNLEIHVIYSDASGQRLDSSLVDKLKLTANQYTHYQNVIYLDQSQRNCAYVSLRIIQISTDTISSIIITGVSLHEIYNAKIPSSNLLALDSAQPKYPEFTSLSTNVSDNKRWLTIKSTGSNPWAGVFWDIPVVTDLPYDPFKLEFDLRGDDIARTWKIAITGWNNSGAPKIDMTVDNIYVETNQIVHISRNIWFPQQVADCTKLHLHITTPDTKPVNYTRISDLSLTLVPQNVNNGNNLLSPLFAYINIPEITSLSMDTSDNKQWLTIRSTGGQAGAGAWWNVPVVTDLPYVPFKLEFDLRGDDTARTWNIGITGWDKSEVQNIDMNVDDIYVESNQIVHISRNIWFPQQVANCAKLHLHITTSDTKPISYTRISDLSLTLVPQTVNNGNNLLSPLFAYIDVPAITSLSMDTTNNKQWLKITSKGGQAGAGAWWNVPVVKDMPNNLFKLEFDLRGDDTARTWNISITGWDNSNVQKINMNVGDIYVDTNQIVHISHNILFPQQVSDCPNLHLHITTSDTNPVSYTRISNLSLTLVPETKSNDTEYSGLPVMDIRGDLTAMSHDNAKNITWTFIDTHQTLNGYGTLKLQGDSSLNWRKKSYRLKTLTSDFQHKDKVKFKATWQKKSKFNLKSYYTDGLMSRDPVNAEIGGAIASSRRDLPNDLVEEDNFGLIQGFPIILTLNGEFAGVYSLNTARPDFDYTKFAIIGSQFNKLTIFKDTNPSVKLDGTDFESLNPEDTPTDEEKQAVNALIQFISTSSDDDFKTKLSDHMSVNSAIDYLIFNNIIGNRDAFAKNQIYLSWDGTHWYLQSYDLDDTYQGGWDGKVFEAPTDIIGTDNNLFARLNTLFSSQIKKRYQEIRAWLTPDYVLNKYKNRIEQIGLQNYQREYAKWNDLAKDTEDFAQLRKAVYTQFKLLDSKWLS